MQDDQQLNEKKTHLMILMMMAESDDNQHESEHRFILDVAKKMGLDEATVTWVKQNPHELTFSLPKTEMERMTLLYHLLFLMKIDGEVSEEEQGLCRELGFRMGFSPLMTDELIQVMVKNVGKKVPDGALLEILKKYLN